MAKGERWSSFLLLLQTQQPETTRKQRGRPKEGASGCGRIPYHSIPECHRRQTIMQLRTLEFSHSRPLCTCGYGKGLRFQTIIQLRRLECSDSRPIMHLWLWKGLDSTPLCSLQELSIKTILLHNSKFCHRTLHCVNLNPEASSPFWLITWCNWLLWEEHNSVWETNYSKNYIKIWWTRNCGSHRTGYVNCAKLIPEKSPFWMIPCCNRLLREGHKQCHSIWEANYSKITYPPQVAECAIFWLLLFLFFSFFFFLSVCLSTSIYYK
jgi:hypothetical protein